MGVVPFVKRGFIPGQMFVSLGQIILSFYKEETHIILVYFRVTINMFKKNPVQGTFF
jgi:hypothetical protein